jgi:hypothetical protein
VVDARVFLNSKLVAAPAQQGTVVQLAHRSIGGYAFGPVHGHVGHGNVQRFRRIVELPNKLNICRVGVQVASDFSALLSRHAEQIGLISFAHGYVCLEIESN